MLAVSAFVLVGCCYAIKMANAPDVVRAEFNHPIGGNLFGTFLISLLLLPMILAPLSLRLAQGIWAVGAFGMLLFAWMMIDRWLSDRQQMAHATPAWFVPVVGLLDVPLALPVLGLPLHGVMVLCLAVGLFFSTPLFTLVFSRLLFEPPLPEPLQPLLLILLAPFAVGTSAYIATTGRVDLFAESLFAVTLFMLLVLANRLRYLGACCPFKISWWAVSFPLAASAVAGLRIADASDSAGMNALAIALLVLATLVILALLGRTVLGIARGELRALSS